MSFLLSKKFAILVGFLTFFLFPTTVFASPSLSITPSGGYVAEGANFTIDILINSDGEDLIQARSVITFDPTKLRIVKAQRNNGLFLQFPNDQQTTDNENGVVMLTGFTQSGSGTLYNTDGNADVFGRITFQAIKEGSVKIDWEYSGQDQPFKSVLLADGSPPQNVLSYKPSSVSFTIQDTGGSIQQPKTGIFDENIFVPGVIGVIGGLSLFSGSSIVLGFSNRLKRRKYRTIVEYDD